MMKNLILIFIIFCSCKPQEFRAQETIEVKKISQDYIMNLLKDNKKISNGIVKELDGSIWNSVLTDQNLRMIQNFDINNAHDLVEFNSIFNNNKIANYQNQHKINNWSEIFPQLKFYSKENSNFFLSLPIFDKTGDYAIFYVGDLSSGDLVVYKKQAGDWKYFAIGNIWIE